MAVFPFVIVFVGSMYTPSDPDLGWHLKYGEHFFKTGQILRDNNFSVMMPDFKWPNTSWGTDLITYASYNMGGFMALSVLGALVVTLTFYFFSKAARLTIWGQAFLFPLLLFLESPINAVSFRGQQISLMLLGVLFYLIALYEKRPNVLYLAIPLFLLWANLHGEFILGLIMFCGWVAVYIFQKLFSDFNREEVLSSVKNSFMENKKDFGSLLLILLLSSAITLANPFGIDLHLDALTHLGNPLLKNIAEYLPFPSLSQAWWNQIIVAVLLGVGLVILYFREKLSTQLPAIVSILFLFILSFSVRRYAWPAYYLILPILHPITGFFKPDTKKATTISSFVILLIIFGITLAGKLPFQKFQTFNWNEYCKDEFILCSPKSANYLSKHNLSSNLYSLYGWGGYLIWNHPEIKPLIDGRMHMWRDEKGYSGFENYYSYEQNLKDIDKSEYDVVYMSPVKPVYNRMLKLVQSKKWKVAYQDSFAGIFVRNK